MQRNNLFVVTLTFVYSTTLVSPSLLEARQHVLSNFSHPQTILPFYVPTKQCLFYSPLFSLRSPMAAPASVSLSFVPLASTSTIFAPAALKKTNFGQIHFRFFTALRRNQGFTLKASMGPPGYTEKLDKNKLEILADAEDACDIFNDLKDRFLSFKKNKYLRNIEQFENLAKVQTPKFMVIACADSRVCPSAILGFQPGEAFMIRNIANLVPPFESGPSETNAALEFSVNSLLVENILVIGHSCCGGIRALMSMQDDDIENSFIKSWVVGGKDAKKKAKAAASNLSFDEQCQHCEKESINHSLLNLLTYPWIEEKVVKGELSIHGGYYDFTNCSFEKWTLDYRGTKFEGKDRIAAKNRLFWS